MFPIVFHAVFGKDDREASSPSFFNVDEILQIKQYVEKLRADRKYRTCKQRHANMWRLWLLTGFLAEDDIGIITPYHAQCVKVRKALGGFANEIKVGSVEEFQGQVSCPIQF